MARWTSVQLIHRACHESARMAEGRQKKRRAARPEIPAAVNPPSATRPEIPVAHGRGRGGNLCIRPPYRRRKERARRQNALRPSSLRPVPRERICQFQQSHTTRRRSRKDTSASSESARPIPHGLKSLPHARRGAACPYTRHGGKPLPLSYRADAQSGRGALRPLSEQPAEPTHAVKRRAAPAPPGSSLSPICAALPSLWAL